MPQLFVPVDVSGFDLPGLPGMVVTTAYRPAALHLRKGYVKVVRCHLWYKHPQIGPKCQSVTMTMISATMTPSAALSSEPSLPTALLCQTSQISPLCPFGHLQVKVPSNSEGNPAAVVCRLLFAAGFAAVVEALSGTRRPSNDGIRVGVNVLPLELYSKGAEMGLGAASGGGKERDGLINRHVSWHREDLASGAMNHQGE